jgi:hypothetical protein
METLSSFNTVEEFSPHNATLVFLDQKFYGTNLINYTNVCTGVILRKGLNDLALTLVEESYVIVPFDQTIHSNPSQLWSKVKVMGTRPMNWHSYIERNKLNNWDFDYGKGIVFTSAKDTLPMEITVQRPGPYALYIRYFQNQHGGVINLALDEQTFEINTTSLEDSFVWAKVGSMNLSEGEHILILENIDGFNAVNLLAVIPQEKSNEYFENIYKLPERFRIIYMLEPENDFSHTEALLSENPEFSNGIALVLNGSSEISSRVDILKNGYYKLAIRALTDQNSSLMVHVGNYSCELNLTSQYEEIKWFNTDPFYLRNTSYNVTFNFTKGTTVDLVSIYTIEAPNETLSDIFKPSKIPAAVVSYDKINPTKYTVQVNATDPFMLALVESYDPLWIALVKGERVRSTPLNSVINGFSINATGTYTITIEYEPQKWFSAGIVITIISLFSCFGYLVIEWKKERSLEAEKGQNERREES